MSAYVLPAARTYLDRVRRGAAMLDDEAPADWPVRLDRDRLDLSSTVDCPFGQLFADIARREGYEDGYSYAVHELGEGTAWVDELGFDVPEGTQLAARQAALTEAWRIVIDERRAAA